MAIAGKVAITPGGEWSATVAYDKLVVVTYNNNVYLSTKPSTGVEPTDTEHWMLLVENVTQEQYDNIINGTTTVGNANKLGGKGASEYLSKFKIGTTGRFYRVFARMDSTKNNEPETVLISGGGNFSNVDGLWAVCFYARPSSNHAFTVRELIPPKNSIVTFGWYAEGNYRYFGMYTDYAYSSVPFITKLDGSSGGGVFNAEYGEFYNSATMPTGWAEVTVEKFAVGADLANYLPNSGGTVGDGTSIVPLTLKGIDKEVYQKFTNHNDELMGYLGFKGKDTPVFRDNTYTDRELLHTGNVGSYALPLSGGTITGTGYTPLQIKDSNYDVTLVRFQGKSGALGELGFDGANNPTFRDTSNNYYPLLHTGNKPTGTYTGNGDATERLIKSAGLGNAVLIWVSGSPDKVTLVTPAGSFAKDSNGITGLQSFSAYVNGGNLRIISTNANLNASGVIYEYQFI